ncbi:hypothetical protein AB6E26_19725, partial [Vibrio splendidus]
SGLESRLTEMSNFTGSLQSVAFFVSATFVFDKRGKVSRVFDRHKNNKAISPTRETAIILSFGLKRTNSYKICRM